LKLTESYADTFLLFLIIAMIVGAWAISTFF